MKMKTSFIFAVFFSLAAGLAYSGSIVVTAPRLGAVLCHGQDVTITWTASGDMDEDVKIRLWRRVDGTDRRVLDISDNTDNDGSHLWNVPATVVEGGGYYIKVITLDEAFQDDGEEFTVSACLASIAVSSPMETGAYMVRGTTPISIAWTSSGITGNVRVDLERWDAAGSYPISASHPYDGSPLSYLVPDGVAAGTYRVKVSQGTVIGYSGRIGILAYEEPSLRLVKPNGGEVLTHGDAYDIDWDAHNLDGHVRIDLLKGGVLYSILTEDQDVNSGRFNWRNILRGEVLAKVVSGNDFKIHIYTQDRRYGDFSDANFSIRPHPGIQVLKPAAGEVWDEDSVKEIRWNAQELAGRTVSISLKFTSGSPLNIRSIAEGVPAMDKHYAWTVMDLREGHTNLSRGSYADAVITIVTEGSGVRCVASSKEFTIRKR